MEVSVAVIILTFNEEKHLERCIKSVLPLTNEVYVIDSYSKDRTKEIAENLGVGFLQNTWINYSSQFTWGLEACKTKADWIFRLDADEYLTDNLIDEIKDVLAKISPSVNGLAVNYRHIFLGKWIRYGTRYPLTLLRIFRREKAYIEPRWMDERIILKEGTAVTLKNDFIHEDLNTITYFIDKHNGYATREAIDLLNKQYSLNLYKDDNIDTGHFNLRMKKYLYSNRSILWVRSFLYFIYRYIFRLGFLDGKEGLVYHFMQGLWYRFLVDIKIIEIESLAKKRGIPILEAMEIYSGYKLNKKL